MRPLAALLLASLTACTVSGTGSNDPADDEAAAEEDAESVVGDEGAGDKGDDPGWGGARTLHIGDGQFDQVAAGDRRVHSLWAAGSAADPIAITVTVEAAEESGTVRVAVLGPLADGQRQVIAADGYTAAKHTVELAARLTESGEHLVVIGSFGLASDSAYTAEVRCAPDHGCDPARVDVLAEPKAGGLVGAGNLIAARLGDVLAARDFDVEMEVWTSPPGLSWAAELAGVSVAGTRDGVSMLPTFLGRPQPEHGPFYWEKPQGPRDAGLSQAGRIGRYKGIIPRPGAPLDVYDLEEDLAESKDLAARARDRRLAPEEYTGGTFSVSNLGMLDIEEFTAIINPPEAGIIAIGRMAEKAVVHEGQIAARKRMRLTMSCDHRVIDGATGAQFLRTLKGMLENPLALVW